MRYIYYPLGKNISIIDEKPLEHIIRKSFFYIMYLHAVLLYVMYIGTLRNT